MTLPIYRPIIPLTVTMIIGILVGEAYPGQGKWVFLLTISSGAALLFFMIRKKAALGLPLLFICSLGYLSIQPWVAPQFPDDHVRHHIDAPAGQIAGYVLSTPVYRNNRTRLVMEMETISTGDQQAKVRGRVRLTIAGAPVFLSKGDRISYFGRIRSIRNFNNPGGFDYERYMAFQKIWSRSYVKVENLSMRTIGKTSGTWFDLDRRRSGVADLIDRQVTIRPDKDTDIRAISKALLIGDRKDISPELREIFNRSGVGHLLAISGLHIGIVATAAFILFRWMASWVPPLLWTGWTRKTAAILTFIPVMAYGLLAGMSPSTQRAVIMVGVFLLTLLLDRDQDLTNTICIAGMLILFIHPPALFSISFQLSFVAVLVIVWGMSLIQTRFKDPKNTGIMLINRAIAFIAVSLFAVLGTAPLVMAYFNQVSLIGIVVNIIAIPLVGFLAVPLGLLGVFFHLIVPPVALACLTVSHWILGISIAIIRFFSDLPFAALETVTPSPIEIGLYYLAMLAGYIWISEKAVLQPFGKQRTRMRILIAKAMIILAAVGWSVDVGYWVHQRFWHSDLRATIFDVGQGSAALIELPLGSNLLIDGGGFSGTAAFDTGRNIIAPYLLRKKIKTIDTIVLSHPNSDHLNGLIYIAKNFRVKKAITNNQPSDTKGYRLFMRALKEHGIDTPAYRTLDGSIQFAGGELEILHPPKDFLDSGPVKNQENINDNSLVVKVSMGQHAFLFPGDIMAMGEKTLVASAPGNLKSTVLISPHHGSDTSSSPLLMAQVDPEIVVVSCGWQNRFRFPSKKILNRYSDRGCRIFRTDKHGAILIRTNGENMKIRTTEPRRMTGFWTFT
jgi:competence protein ComEC